MSRFTRVIVLVITLVLLAHSALASNFQYFSGIDYSNPAELAFFVKDTQFIAGDEVLSPAPNVIFNGTITVPDPAHLQNVVDSGVTSNTGTSNFLYGRLAKRLTPQWIIDVDVTEPYKSDIIYPDNSAVRYAVTSSIIHSVNVSPIAVYQFSGTLSNLAIGAGLDASYMSADLNSMVPSFPNPAMGVPFGAGPDGSITNHVSNWAYSWHVGAIYHLLKSTFLGLSYFAPITQNFSDGLSTFSGFPNSNNLSTTVNLPAVVNFGMTHFLSEKWIASLQIYYSQWSRLQEVTLNNTAGPAPTHLIEFNYKNTWRFDLGTRYGVTPKVTLGALVSYDQTPTNNVDRVLGLPGANLFTVGALAEYKLNKTTSVTATYGHVFSVNVPFDNVDPGTGITTVGTGDVYGNMVGLRLTVNV